MIPRHGAGNGRPVISEPSSWRFECYDELPSTSDACIERAGKGEADGLAILALSQTRARGSRGRIWADPGDSLALSVLLRPDDTERAGNTFWAFIAAVAFYDGLANESISHRLRIKWPNDVLLDGRKLGGLLVEVDGTPAEHVVIGFGANLVCSPRISGRHLACLAEHVPICDPHIIAPRILERLTHWRRIFQRDGFDVIKRAWLARSLPIGSPLVVSDGKTYSHGLFMGLGEGGELLLDREGKRERFVTGEIFYGDFSLRKMEADCASGH
ncbi:biotin--[acetyl-CoA-carboxylase] ligase [Acetobacter musti]|uniref:Biotin--[acetyl-CoA-carboxylase] ligase n=1 Tax=Acetobacter musti TaxID=864732 RepID=A0ABX0JN46_9PROT|nr:biotin--[acetyl-CoA-carboxylase] ligase [Acetobacter musti]NHN83916.1 biotin--[acetyl-CoA-carboxylase] ligase [Acetobacter musti]